MKTRALKDRLFDSFAMKMMNISNDFPFTQKFRWLSKGNFLKRFNELFDTIVQFLDGFNPELSDEIKIRKHDIAFLSDIFDKLNSLNLQLQGQDVN